MTLYSVSEVANLTGVTIKTLHYYQKINLLNPAKIAENNYRYYSDKEIDKLQEIMFYRTLEIPLAKVRELMSENESKDRIEILEEQLLFAKDKYKNLDQVIKTIEQTIQVERGHGAMKHEDKFKGLKTEDSIYRTMQNMTVIFSKPVNVVFLILCLAIVGVHGSDLLHHRSIYGESTGAYVMSAMMVVLGIIGAINAFKNVFKVKTKDLLDTINSPYRRDKNQD